MKKYTLLYSAAALLMLAGCDDYNDRLDGYTGDYTASDAKALSYTLTDNDYKTIATSDINKGIALAASPEDSVVYKALAKVSSNKYMTQEVSGRTYIPAFLSQTYPTADDGSAIKVTYKNLVGEPEYLAALGKANTYKVSDKDYETVWSSKGINASYLTPKTMSKIPALLKAEMTDAQAGDVALVNYSYSNTEPSYGNNMSETEVAGPWQALAVNTYSDGNTWNFVSNTTDLSAYAGKKVQIGFCYSSDGTNSNTSTWEVKNVAVTASGSPIFSESFASSLGEFTTEGEEALPAGLSFVWSYNSSGYAKASAYASGSRYETEVYLVSPTMTLTSGAQLSFDHVYRYGAEPSNYLKLFIREIITTSGGSSNGYYKVNEFGGAGDYLIVAEADGAQLAATPLTKAYGYWTGTDFSGTTGFIAESDESKACAYTFAATAAGYSIFGSDNRYAYMAGTYNSFNFSDAYGNEGYDWTVTANGDGTFMITNVTKSKYIQYSANYSSFGSYADAQGLMPALYKYKGEVQTKAVTRASTPVVSYNASAVYVFNGSSWAEYEENGVNVAAINPHVYNSLGVEYVANPATVLPTYLAGTYPYASEGDKKTVVYYASSSKSVEAKEFTLLAGEWILTTNTEEVTDQFVRVNKMWVYDPSVVITLPYNKSDISVAYYQAATDWVWANIDQKVLGLNTKGQGYVTSYGNNEYYTGCSAYYGNVDWRPAKAKEQYATGYEGMSDDEIVAKMQENFIEVMAEVLAIQNPDAVSIEGVDVTYTINFTVYPASAKAENWTIQYKVVGNAKFEYIEESLKMVE